MFYIFTKKLSAGDFKGENEAIKVTQNVFDVDLLANSQPQA